ncbi:MAG: hypothetical protein JSW68_04560, partial [Burkholderiales bacterium]
MRPQSPRYRNARAALCLMLLAVATGASGAAPKAEVECVATDTRLEYDCTIELSRDGAPIDAAQMSVTADMPSMP